MAHGDEDEEEEERPDQLDDQLDLKQREEELVINRRYTGLVPREQNGMTRCP